MGRKPLLTKDQVLLAIQRWVVGRGTSPSIEQLRVELGVGSTRTVFRYLQLLEEDGTIERLSEARGLRLLKPQTIGVQTRAVPLVGQVAAGQLTAAEESLEGWIRLPKTLLRPPSGKFFLLRVRGDSMNRARVEKERLEDGDLALVRQQATASAGDIVVALVDGEATVKRLVQGRGYWLLKPESSNPKHQPIVVDKDFRIQGLVCGVLKNGSEILRDTQQPVQTRQR